MGFFVVVVKLLLCLALTAAHLQHESDRKLLGKTAKTKGGLFDINSEDGYAYQCSCQRVLKLAKNLETPSGIKPHVSEELIRGALQAKLNRKSKIEEIENRNSELLEIEEGILDVPVVLTYQYPDPGDNVLVSVQPAPSVYAPIEEGFYSASFEDRPSLDYLPVAQTVNVYYQPEAPIIEEIIVDGPDASILNSQNIAIVVNRQPIKKDTPKVFVDQPEVRTHPKTKPHQEGTIQSVVHHKSKPTVEASPKSKPLSLVDTKHQPKSPNRFINHGPSTLQEPTTPKKEVYHDPKRHPIEPHRKISGKGHYTKQPSQPRRNVSGKESEEGHKSPQSKEKRKKGGKWAFTPGQQQHQKGVHKKPTHIKQEKYVPQPAHSYNQASGKGYSSEKPDQPHKKASGNEQNRQIHPKDKNTKEYGESHGSRPSKGKKKKGGKLVYSPGQQVHENGVHKEPIHKNQGGGDHQQPVQNNEKQPTPSHKEAPVKGHYSHRPAHSHEKASGKGHYNEKHPKRSGGRHVEKQESRPKGKKKKGGKWIFTPGQQEVQKSAHDKHPKGKAKDQGEYAQGHHAPKNAKSHGHGKEHDKKVGHEVNYQSASGHNKHPKKQTDGHGHQRAHGHQNGHKEGEKKHRTNHGKEQKKKGHGVKHQSSKGERYGQVHHGPKQPKGSVKGHGVSSHKEHGQQPGGKAKGQGKGQGGKGHELKHGSRYEKHPKGKSEGHGKYVQGYKGRNQRKNHRKEHDKHPKKKAQEQRAKGTHRGNGHNEVGKDHSKDHGKGHGKNAYGAKHESGHNKHGHPKGKAKGQGQYVAQGHKAPSKGQGVKLASGKSGKSAAKGKAQLEGQYSESYDEEPFEVIKATPGKWTWQETDEEEEEDGGSQGGSWSWSSEDSSDKAGDDGGSNGGHSWSWSSEDGGDSPAKSDASGTNEGYSGESKSWSSEEGGGKSGKKPS